MKKGIFIVVALSVLILASQLVGLHVLAHSILHDSKHHVCEIMRKASFYETAHRAQMLSSQDTELEDLFNLRNWDYKGKELSVEKDPVEFVLESFNFRYLNDTREVDINYVDSLFKLGLEKCEFDCSHTMTLMQRVGNETEQLDCQGHFTGKCLFKNFQIDVPLDTEKTMWYRLSLPLGLMVFRKIFLALILGLLFDGMLTWVVILTLKAVRGRERYENRFYTMTHSIVHDMKNPVSVACLACEMLMQEEECSGSKIQKCLNLIHGHLMNLNHQMERILFQLKEKRKIMMPSEEIMLLPYIEKIVQYYKEDMNAQADFVVDIAPECSIIASQITFSSVVRNLIDNSLKYAHPRRRPLIEIKTYGNTDGSIVFSVKDNGMGIKKKHIKKIFRQYYRGETHGTDGYGIGLYSVSLTAKEYGWKLDVESTEGKGTEIIITISNRI